MEAAKTTRHQLREHTLVHFEIPATEPSKLTTFYRQLFQWKFIRMGGLQEYYMISHKEAISENDTMGGIYKRNSPNDQFLNYFNVKSIDDSISKAASLGAKIITGKQEIPHMGYMAVLADPDGNTFALFQSAGRM